MKRSNLRKACLVPALVLLGACGGSEDHGSATPACDGGSPGASDSSVDALSADAPAADAVFGDVATADAPAADAVVGDVATAADALVADAPVTGAVTDATFASDTAADAAARRDAAPSTCDDGIEDGDETDVDCGGSCSPCGIGQACLASGDCGSSPGCSPKNGCACDAVSLTCVYDHCFDHAKDGDETDVDCGDPVAGCTGCAVGKMCQVDGDCASRGCDATSSTCVQTQCADHQQDGLETGVDCGGGVCPECALGQGCGVDDDCTSAACDLVSFVCIQDQCADNRQDGAESDIDCGGSVCVARCHRGQGCLSNLDCVAGNFCNASRICQ